ncbi:MAG: hypothetical protein GYB36_03490 [Alphaproteobacteria bacterium]|nr:hypothetical protein [Alphaproteobacteria bacterium]
MGEIVTFIADELRALESQWLAALAAASFASFAILLILSGRWLRRAFSSDPQKTLWRFTKGGSDERVVTILERGALTLDLHNGDDVEVSGINGSPVSLVGTINHQRRATPEQVDEDHIRLSEDLFVTLAKQLRAPTNSPVIQAEVKFSSRGYFWNHPDRSKRYSNRVTVWVTLWTTVLTTLIAIAIEFLMN